MLLLYDEREKRAEDNVDDDAPPGNDDAPPGNDEQVPSVDEVNEDVHMYIGSNLLY